MNPIAAVEALLKAWVPTTGHLLILWAYLILVAYAALLPLAYNTIRLVVDTVTGLFLRWKLRRRLQAKHRMVAKQRKAASVLVDNVKEHGVSRQRKQEVLAMDAQELHVALQERSVTAVEALMAYADRALALNASLGFLAEIALDKALATARELDEGPIVGPLHGMPVSIKECIHVEDMDSTVGFAKKSMQPNTANARLVDRLEEAGAVIWCTTNLCQGTLTIESVNPVYGTVKNPLKMSRTAGGSSGGEGAMIAAGASPVGVGTDIGGSIRTPAHFCGIYGLKPTAGRIDKTGCPGSIPGFSAIKSTPGPMSANVDMIRVMSKVLFDTWQEEEEEELENTLRVGYYAHDGWFAPSAAVQRAVDEAKAALEAQGHELVEFQPPDMVEMFQTYFNIMSSAKELILGNIRGEEPIPQYTSLRVAAALPQFVRSLLVAILRLFGYSRMATFLSSTGDKTVAQFLLWQQRRDQWADKMVQKMRMEKLDVLLCPVNPLPAIPHGAASNVISTISSAILVNLANLPAGVVPVTTVKDSDSPKLLKRPHEKRDLFDIAAEKTLVGTTGLPIGLQIVGLPNQDERVISAMEILASALDAAQNE